MVSAPSPLRLAVFTSTYPARVATFFERDMRALLEAGVAIDVFAVAPLDPRLWRYRLDILGEDILPRHRVHTSASWRAWRTRDRGRCGRSRRSCATRPP